MSNINLIYPDWPAPANIKAIITTRNGGHSSPPYHSFNLATHVGDNPVDVMKNRAELAQQLPSEPIWLEQTHTNKIIELKPGNKPDESFDASMTTVPGLVCAVLTADCLPILLTDTEGSFVAAIHAGWRGLANGIIGNALATESIKSAKNRSEVLAWLGPAISQKHFEVGDDVRDVFLALSAGNHMAFVSCNDKRNKWLADIYALATRQLNALGVNKIYGGEYCSYAQDALFHSYRRDGVSGRMASCIWIESEKAV